MCYIVCQIEHCECFSVSTPDRYKTYRPVCEKNLAECGASAILSDLNEKVKCDCPPLCHEQVYSYTYSGRQWPHANYLKDVLIAELCNRYYKKPFYESLCNKFQIDNLTDTDLSNMSRNFAAVHVYFEDLNYELLEEEPLYNPVRFLSDIGGAMGLFTGASLLTYFEILHVIV